MNVLILGSDGIELVNEVVQKKFIFEKMLVSCTGI